MKKVTEIIKSVVRDIISQYANRPLIDIYRAKYSILDDMLTMCEIVIRDTYFFEGIELSANETLNSVCENIPIYVFTAFDEVMGEIKSKVWYVNNANSIYATESPKRNVSYSQCEVISTCDKRWYTEYCLHKQGLANGGTVYGTAIHSAVASGARGEVALGDVYDEFETQLNTLLAQYDDNERRRMVSEITRKHYLDHARNYLTQKFGLEIQNYIIVGVEEEFHIEFDDCILDGFVDAILIDEKTGKVVIYDYKTEKKFEGNDLKAHQRQLYLYAAYVKKTYGVYPDLLIFRHFRFDGDEGKNVIVFNENDYNEAIEWANKCARHADELQKAIEERGACPQINAGWWCNWCGCEAPQCGALDCEATDCIGKRRCC